MTYGRCETLAEGAIYKRLGAVAQTIGRCSFNEELWRLLGFLLPHDSGWVVRYSHGSPPDILFTEGIRQHIVNYYLTHGAAAGDPFFCDWKHNKKIGVVSLSEALPAAEDRHFYPSLFQIKADFSDEIAILLPSVGPTCFSLFLERRDQGFTDADLHRVRLVLPAIEGLHRAHLSRLLGNLPVQSMPRSGKSGGKEMDEPILIVDRYGKRIHMNRSWREAEQDMPRIAQMLEALPGIPSADLPAELPVSRTCVLRIEPLSKDFSLAPGGHLIRLDHPSSAIPEPDIDHALRQAARLTPRERDILYLAMNGLSTGEMAQQLKISKGSIKNCRLRIYKKLGVSSDRAMILTFLPLMPQVRQSYTGSGAGPRLSDVLLQSGFTTTGIN